MSLDCCKKLNKPVMCQINIDTVALALFLNNEANDIHIPSLVSFKGAGSSLWTVPGTLFPMSSCLFAELSCLALGDEFMLNYSKSSVTGWVISLLVTAWRCASFVQVKGGGGAVIKTGLLVTTSPLCFCCAARPVSWPAWMSVSSCRIIEVGITCFLLSCVWLLLALGLHPSTPLQCSKRRWARGSERFWWARVGCSRAQR